MCLGGAVICNVVLLVLGLIAVGLAATQFTRVGLDNYRQIDLRILNYFHCLVGAIGLYCVGGNHGSIVLKTLYVVSLVLSISTAVFYAFTTFRIVSSHKEMVQLETISNGFVTNTIGWDTHNYPGKVVISSLMIVVATLAAITVLAGLILLEKLVIVERPHRPSDEDQRAKAKTNITQLTVVAFLKLILGLCAVGLAIFLEYEHELLGGRDDYIKIGLDHIAGLLVVSSAVMDLYAVFNKLHSSLNFKVSIALSIVAGVWCLKSVDNNMFPYYKIDITAYRVSSSLNPFTALTSGNYPQLVIVVIHGILLGLLSLLFLLSCFTVLIAAACLRRNVLKVSYSSEHRSVVVQGSDLPWNGDYIGGDMLWLVVLFSATGILGSSHQKTAVTAKFLMNIVCFSVAVEKALASINLIYQSAHYPTYANINVTDRKTYVGQIVLHSVQCTILFCEMVTALYGSIAFGKTLSRQNYLGRHSSGVHLCLSLGTLFYGIIMTASCILFEYGKWKFSEVPLDVPFFRLGNGPLALAVFFVQSYISGGCMFLSQLLIAATILQVVVCALALFVISSTMTNLYYIQVILKLREMIGLTGSERAVLVVALVLAAVAVLACVLATWGGIFLFAPPQKSSQRSGAEECSSITTAAPVAVQPHYVLNREVVRQAETPSPTYQSPLVHQIAIKPIEEQTLYWSADENPYIYKSTKRYYGQPYQMDSGYQSSYASPTKYYYDNGGGEYYYEDSAQASVNNSPPLESTRTATPGQSMATQTRIAHVFPHKICRYFFHKILFPGLQLE
uniref:Uncharacterized protein n=1 Tax=Ditylenchus dipsaci TaxID=166011 RepID=A0A915DSC2_9BILA